MNFKSSNECDQNPKYDLNNLLLHYYIKKKLKSRCTEKKNHPF